MVALVGILVTLSLPYSQAFWGNGNKVNTAVFLSPKFVLGPGSVESRFYFNVDFPRGHIAVKSFDAEVIDEAGDPVPLHHTFLHHWLGLHFWEKQWDCQNIFQFFGLGSETRKTATNIPDPYGIEFGNPAEIPSGFEEQWMLNIHAIDTRGVEDKLGCTECRCDLYNVTVDEYGRPLRPDYKGGLSCCYDHTQCKVKQGFEGVRRMLYLQYTVKWVDMDSYVLPVQVYIFDVTDTWKRTPNSTGIDAEHQCMVEYDIEPCHATGLAGDGCVDNRRISLDMPFGGYLVYGMAHQHSGGTGWPSYVFFVTDLREGGRMTTCYPQPGAIEISKGETLILESNYSSIRHHTGVMGNFYIMVADQLPKPMLMLHAVVRTQDGMLLSTIIWAAVALIGVVAAIIFVVLYRLKREGEDGYEAIGI
ncbi:putative carbonyl reductase [Hibiscus syriacus]|uniref:Carbonyl reductase n=1 Tax=Hibiscus syriacus TaxID=106335 RepID=A0A6A3AIR7_HIBSY|nr:putative carbonyl reductase [Hibiscus syriacus]